VIPVTSGAVQRLSAVPARIVETTMVGLGLWQLFATIGVRLGWSFRPVAIGALLVAVLTPFIAWGIVPAIADNSSQFEAPTPSKSSQWLLLLTALALVVWQLGAPWLVAWFAGLLYIGKLVHRGPSCAPSIDTSCDGSDALALALSACAGSLAALSIHRPERDDAYYFNQILTTLEHANLPVLSFDGMHGDVTLPIQQVAHKAQTYELLLAVVSHWTGADPGNLYWIVAPALTAPLLVLSNWLLLRTLLGSRVARLATPILVLILVAWGGHYITHANFAFSRLFQGKSVFVSAVVPFLLYASYRFIRRPSLEGFLLLALGQCAGAAFTSTALVIAPLAVAAASLAGARWDRRGLQGLSGALASTTPAVVMLLLVKRDVSALGGLAADGKVLWLHHVLEPGWRGAIAILLILGLPLVARRLQSPGWHWLERYVAIIFVMALNSFAVMALVPYLGQLFSWRFYWFIPFPALLAGAVAGALVATWNLPGRQRLLGSVPLALLVAFLAAGPWTFEGSNFASLQFATWKVEHREFAVASHVVERTAPGDTVLAHPFVASRLTSFADGPVLLAVRPNYVQNLARHYGDAEASSRSRLLEFARSGRKLSTKQAIDALDARCVVAFVPAASVHKKHPDLAQKLESSDYTRQDLHGYVVWIRPPPCK
jgi:hypothetical protein